MGLFFRRPLVLFCTFFLVTSLIMIRVDFSVKLYLSLIIGAVIVILSIISFFLKNREAVLLTVILCLVSILFGIANSAFRMDLKEKKAEEWIGKRQIVADIREISYQSENSSVYVVDIERMSDREAGVKALLVLGFKCELSVGDRVVSTAEIMKMSDEAMGRSGYERTNDKDVLLTAVVYEPHDSQVYRFNRSLPLSQKLFCENGFHVVADEIKNALSVRADRLVGNEYGAIMNGLLLGDVSDVSTEVLRDFRRSGVSHLFAVSGLHISVLLGAAELVLRHFLVPKKARCVTVSGLALVLLILTGFSMSAFRSVLMLWMVYVAFAFSEESDAPTSLFLSIAIILLVFPYAVFELGMWMSFLATLGLVTVYVFIDSAIPRVKKGITVLKILMKTSRFILMVTVMTVLANMFLLPIQWGIFGEISAVSVLTNIILSPLNAVMLILSMLCLIFGNVPILGYAFCFCVKGVCAITVDIVRFFSKLNGATVSLKYSFVTPIVVLFCLALITVMTLKFKRKWLVSLPFVGFVAAFTVGIAIFNIVSPRSVTYYGENTQEIISITDRTELCVIDMSNGAYTRLDEVFEDAEKYGATDIDTIVFTDIGKRHISTVEKLFRSRIVGRIYIPAFAEKEMLEYAYELCAVADRCGVESFIYQNGEVISVGGTDILMLYGQTEEIFAVSAFIEGEHNILGYTDVRESENGNFSVINYMLAKCDTVLIGNNGVSEKRRELNTADNATVIYSSQKMSEAVRNTTSKDSVYVNPYDKLKIEFVFE